MNKKLLSMVIAGVLAVTSIPSVSASAKKDDYTKVETTTMRGTGYARKQYIGWAISKGAEGVDSNDNCLYYYAVGEKLKVYGAGKNNPSWYLVNDPVCGWVYVRQLEVELI